MGEIIGGITPQESLLMVAIAALSSAVVYLYMQNRSQFTQILKISKDQVQVQSEFKFLILDLKKTIENNTNAIINNTEASHSFSTDQKLLTQMVTQLINKK